MRRTFLACLCLATPALADRIEATSDCAHVKDTLHFTCNITLDRTDGPVAGAAFTVTPNMPSMPMAHNIPPSEAAPTDVPGIYSVDLHLDMPGDWTLTLDLTQPRRDRLVISQSFEDGMAHSDSSEPVKQANPVGHADHTGHTASE